MGNARKKLNVAYFNGSLLVAVLLGLIAGSWAVFWAALVVTLIGGVYGGDIRPYRRQR
jgi:1,4-dihydroxy-2-naphthoate octaprenyltransferase